MENTENNEQPKPKSIVLEVQSLRHQIFQRFPVTVSADGGHKATPEALNPEP